MLLGRLGNERIMNKRFWKDRNVLITGYEGFLGSNLTKYLISCGAAIVGLDIKVRRKNTILIKDDYKNVVVIKGSVVNYKLLKDIIKRYKIDIIFHLAAEALVGECFKRPLRNFSSNIKGTWNVLEAARLSNRFISVIVSSSDKAYGCQKSLPYKETFSLMGCHPYDVSKSCADLLSYTYFKTYNLPVCIIRSGNIYGPGDFHFSRIIPDALSCAIKDKQLLIRSDGSFTRDYIYVEDVVLGYTTLAEKMRKLNLFGEAFNFSNGEPISVLALTKTIFRIANREPNYKILNKAKYEIKHQYLSSKKANKILDWRPKFNLEEGLRKTIKWHRDYFNNK